MNVNNSLKLLLVSDDAERGGALQQLFRQCGVSGVLRRIDAGRAAVTGTRWTTAPTDGPSPDLVLLDFAAPDTTMFSIAKRLGVGSERLAIPLVLLTSERGEADLRSGVLDFDESRVFAPTDLECFVENLARQPRRRVLRALAILSGLGPILVRMPGSLVRARAYRTALSA